jgi:hypothetical protein
LINSLAWELLEGPEIIILLLFLNLYVTLLSFDIAVIFCGCNVFVKLYLLSPWASKQFEIKKRWGLQL